MGTEASLGPTKIMVPDGRPSSVTYNLGPQEEAGTLTQAEWSKEISVYLGKVSKFPDIQYLRRYIEQYREIELKKPILHGVIIDYHSHGDTCSVTTTSIGTSPKALTSQLCAPNPKSLLSRMVLISRQASLRNLGKAVLGGDEMIHIQNLMRLKIVADTLIISVAASWNLEKDAFARLIEANTAEVDADRATALSRQKIFGAWRYQLTRNLADPAVFESDFKMYTSAPHTRLPTSDLVKFCTSFPDRGLSRSIILCDSYGDMKYLAESLKKNLGAANGFQILPLAFDLQIDSAQRSLSTIRRNLSNVKYLARQNPSYIKLNYILHLQDHLQVLCSSMRHRQRRYGSLKHQSKPTKKDFRTYKFKAHAEIEELLFTAAELETEAENMCKMIKDQMAAKDSARNKLLAVLAAVYLPFTLATGILSTNINEFFKSSAPSWPVLVKIGLPLAAITIALPLFFDSAYKLISRFARNRSNAFSLIVVGVPSLLVVVIIVVVLVVGNLKA